MTLVACNWPWPHKSEFYCLKLISSILYYQFPWSIETKRNFYKAAFEITITHLTLFLKAFWLLPAWHEKLSQKKCEIVTIVKTHFYKNFIQPALNLLYYSTILLKWPRISTGMRISSKNIKRKSVNPLDNVEDNHSPVNNTFLFMIKMLQLDFLLCWFWWQLMLQP